jgi:tRNA(Ile)-lysidine synthase
LIPATLLQRFTQFILTNNLIQKGNRLLVAVSGGLDSAVLCHLCHTAGYSFAIAHCNFGLRGTESNRDEAFVRSLAQQYAVPLFVRNFETALFAREHKLSIQEAARKLRYDWFAELVNGEWSMGKEKYDSMGEIEKATHSPLTIPHARLLTAHHLDDNIETVVMNFFKGTGISGLRGMLPRQGHIVRPLLFAQRSLCPGARFAMGGRQQQC